MDCVVPPSMGCPCLGVGACFWLASISIRGTGTIWCLEGLGKHHGTASKRQRGHVDVCIQAGHDVATASACCGGLHGLCAVRGTHVVPGLPSCKPRNSGSRFGPVKRRAAEMLPWSQIDTMRMPAGQGGASHRVLCSAMQNACNALAWEPADWLH